MEIMLGVSGIILTVFGILLKMMQSSIDKLAKSVNELVKEGAQRDLNNKEAEGRMNSLEGNVSELQDISKEHEKRISSLELFKGKIVLVHNKEHPSNQI